MWKIKAWFRRVLPEDRQSRIACIVCEILAVILIVVNIAKRVNLWMN